jgi:ribose transport system substrate-binding protein
MREDTAAIGRAATDQRRRRDGRETRRLRGKCSGAPKGWSLLRDVCYSRGSVRSRRKQISLDAFTEDIMGFAPEKELSDKCRGPCFAAVMAVLNAIALSPAGAETIATFTRNPSNPILRGVRIGGEIAAKSLDAKIVHFIPRSEAPAEQLGLVDEVVLIKPDAVVLAPFDPKAMVPAVAKLNAAGIPVTNVNERLDGGDVVAYVGTDDYQLALTTARYLINAMGKKGNVVILEGPDNLPTSIARVKAYKDAIKEFPDVKLLASKSANYARAPAIEVMKSFLRLFPEIDGVLAANDPMAIGAVEALKVANRKALVIGINASKEVIDFVKSGDILGSGDYNGFIQGCLGTQIAIRNLRKQPTPKEVNLKAVVMDKTNYQDYETPIERRACPTLEKVLAD